MFLPWYQVNFLLKKTYALRACCLLVEFWVVCNVCSSPHAQFVDVVGKIKFEEVYNLCLTRMLITFDWLRDKLKYRSIQRSRFAFELLYISSRKRHTTNFEIFRWPSKHNIAQTLIQRHLQIIRFDVVSGRSAHHTISLCLHTLSNVELICIPLYFNSMYLWARTSIWIIDCS